MAEAVLSEGLVLAVTNASGGVFPFACAKNATLSISRDTLELAPRTNGVFREYIQNRMSFTVSGNGLVKMAESNMQPITFFDTFIEGTDQEFLCYLDIIDKTGNYKVYQFTAFITSLSISSNVNEFGSYDYTLQGTGPLLEITSVDSYVVSSGKITARSTATYKLVAVGIEGKWYYNYTVTNGRYRDWETDRKSTRLNSSHRL